ncbi:MAG: glycosyltransferase, partial [Planctomycetales bacterium]|nr:glycosyltransferase [Planctomycetales bacterium]
MFPFGFGAPLQSSTRLPLEDRGPLRTLFLLSNMPVGGAEVLLSNLMDRFDPDRIQPEFACLKDLGELGEEMAVRFKATSRLIKGKYDVAVVRRLASLMVRHRIDAVVTVGAGDKMFWGRIAAKVANVPVILSALHSTGWPDGVGKLNRMLTSWTDGFIAVASEHGRFLREFEKFPADKVFVIPNGVDTQRFVRNEQAGQRIRNELNIPPDAPVIGIVAALRPEKNHALFLEAAKRVAQVRSDAHFVIVGDGPCRTELEHRS